MICLYDQGNENYGGNGDVVLMPLKCSHTQVAAGKYDLTMVINLDPEGKWTHVLPEGTIIKAPVQEETIESAMSGMDVDLYRTTTAAALRSGPSEPTPINYSQWNPNAVYSVGDKVSVSGWRHRNYQCNYFDAESPITQVPPYNSSWWSEIADNTSGSPVLVNLKSGTNLYFVSSYNNTWAKMSTQYGLEGYIKKSQMVYVRHLTPEETQPREIRTQLFRVKTVNIDSKTMQMTVTAEHVSYDLSGVLVKDARINRRNPATAIAWMEQSFMIEYRGTIATNLTSDQDGDYTGVINGKNAIYALLDPDKGIVSSFQATYRRDNWDIFIMRKETVDRGFQLRYKKNMLGVSWNIRTDRLVNRVVPVAKDADGNDFYLAGTEWVDSSRISGQPVIRMERISVKGQVGKDDGTESGTTWTEEALRAEMAKQAQKRYDVDKADQPLHEITVDFEILGDTNEYPELRGLEKALMYDTVTCINEEIGLSVQAEVVEIEYDCIRKRVTALKLSNIVRAGGRSVSGYNVFNNSITGNKLTDDAKEEIIGTTKEDAVEEAAAYTRNRINNLNNSLRRWVTDNFAPIDEG